MCMCACVHMCLCEDIFQQLKVIETELNKFTRYNTADVRRDRPTMLTVSVSQTATSIGRRGEGHKRDRDKP